MYKDKDKRYDSDLARQVQERLEAQNGDKAYYLRAKELNVQRPRQAERG